MRKCTEDMKRRLTKEEGTQTWSISPEGLPFHATKHQGKRNRDHARHKDQDKKYNTKRWQGYGKITTSVHCWWENGHSRKKI